ncbi:MAG: DUF1559 domain-containing protein [Planctomycetota bacterium]|nr:MAG: DUF1559 domain-containing protein [Planctomycetota bacterium]
MRHLLTACTLLFATMASSWARAADDDAGLAALMDETAMAVVRIDISAEGPATTFASLAFPEIMASSQTTQWHEVFQKLLTAAGVRHLYLIVQLPDRLPTTYQPVGIEALCAIPFDTPEEAEALARLQGIRLPERGWRIAAGGRYCLVGPKALVDRALAGNHPPRPGLEQAVAAAGDAPLALVVAPTADQRHVLSAVLRWWPAEQGGRLLQAWADRAAWTTVAYKPDESLQVTMQAESPESANALAGTIGTFLTDTVAKVRKINAHPVQMDALLSVLDQRVENDKIVLAVDLQELPPADNPFLQATNMALWAIERQRAVYKLRKIGIALQTYHDVHKRFPDAASRDADGKPLLSWRVHLLPYLEDGDALYKEFHLDEPWDSEHNRPLVERMPDVYRLGGTGELPPGKTCVVLPIGEATAWPAGRGRPIREYIDGTSNTIQVVEADDEHAVVWTQPADLAYDPEHPTAGLGGHFGSGFLALTADSASHFLPLDIDPDTLRKLFTAAGKEPVSWPGQ